jgi:hypothetical protein
MTPIPLWIVPILEWFHSTMSGLTDKPIVAAQQKVAAARWRCRRTTGLWLTIHALDRFIERWRPGLDRTWARVELFELMAGAERVGDAQEAELWRNGEVRFIVREDRVLTVLPKERTVSPVQAGS